MGQFGCCKMSDQTVRKFQIKPYENFRSNRTKISDQTVRKFQIEPEEDGLRLREDSYRILISSLLDLSLHLYMGLLFQWDDAGMNRAEMHPFNGCSMNSNFGKIICSFQLTR